MKKITAQSLKDYQTCALLYKYRYGEEPLKEKLDTRDRLRIKFEESIKRVAAFFFYKKQSFSEPSYNSLQNRWQKLWFAEGTNAADIAVMRNEVAWFNEVSYTSNAAAALLAFFEDFSNKPEQEVILLDEIFHVPMGKDAFLTGSFDLVTRTKKPNGFYRYDIYKWVVNNAKGTVPNYWLFDLTLAEYAFKFRNNNAVLDTHHHLWNFGIYMPGDKEVMIERKDIDLLRFWVNELINEEVFPNRRGLTNYCKSCPFDLPCSLWEAPPLTSVSVEK